MKRVVSLFLSLVMLVSTIACVDLSAYASANEGYQTIEEKNNVFQQYYIDRHIKFAKSNEYSDLMSNERWTYILNEASNSTIQNIAEAAQGILQTADSVISLKFNDVNVKTDAYSTVVTNLFTSEETSNVFTELYDKYIDLDTVNYYKKLKKIFQSDEKWDKSLDFEFEMEQIWNLTSDYKNNKFCKCIQDILMANGQTKFEVDSLFQGIEAWDKVSGALGDISTLMETFTKCIQYKVSIEAFKNTTDEFKIVFGQLNQSNNSNLNSAVNTFINCLDDEYAEEYLKTKILQENAFATVDILNGVLKKVVIKGIAKIFGLAEVAAGKVSAVLFAYDVGFSVGNAITGNDEVYQFRQLLHANAELEKQLYSILSNYRNSLLNIESYSSAKLFDAAFNMFKSVQLFSLKSYSEMLNHQKDTVLTCILAWAKIRDKSEYVSEIEFCAQSMEKWSTKCHNPNILVTSDYLDVNSNHMYTIACPTNVKICGKDDNILVEIIDDKVVYYDKECIAIVSNSVKVIIVPSSIECKVTITGTDSGIMNYSIKEYSDNDLVRTIDYYNIPLEEGIVYSSSIPDKIMQKQDLYPFISKQDNKIIKPDYDSLPSIQDTLTDVVVAEELFDGFSTELVDTVADAMFNMKSSVNIESYAVSADDVVALFSAIAKYYPVEYSLIANNDFTYRIICSPERNVITSIRFYYGDEANLTSYERRVKELNSAIDDIVTQMEGMSDFEKILFAHDYIVLNSEYDLELLDILETEGTLSGELKSERYTEYSILVNGTGICGSYALAYRALLNAAGVECLYLSSAEMNHAWNMVKLDGNWYHVDCCWDDPVPNKYARANRNYFLRTDEEIMNLSHYSWSPGTYKASNSAYSNMPRNYDIVQKYDGDSWYCLSNDELYKYDENGKNSEKIATLSTNTFDVCNGNIYYVKSCGIYKYNQDDESSQIVYYDNALSDKTKMNLYVNGDIATLYFSEKNGDEIKYYSKNLALNENFYGKVTGISISQTEAELTVFDTLLLTGDVASTGTYEYSFSPKWTSSNTNVASVNSVGQVSANNVGTAKITATFDEYSVSCNITVVGDNLSGTCGDNAKWNFDPETGTLIVSGSGKMSNYGTIIFPSFSTTNPPWYNFSSEIKKIEIEDSITSVGTRAFSGCSNLYSINLPDSITNIGSYAFSSCSSLENVTLPHGLEGISNSTFSYCTSLKEITIPETVTSIGRSAFDGCSSLADLKIPNNVTSINDFAFRNCELIKEIIIPDSVNYIGSAVFQSCASLEKVLIPNSITEIPELMFDFCKSLKEVELPGNITVINRCAFSSCSSLTDIIIPKGVTDIKNDAFSNCESLQNIAIPDSVTNIETSAFTGCVSFTEVIIPHSVKNIGESAFSNCTNLKKFVVNDNNYFSVDEIGVLFNKDKTKLIQFPIGNDLSSYDMPSTVVTIGRSAFAKSHLSNVSISENATSIESFAFSNCDKLNSMRIPKSISDISSYAFDGCLNIEKFIVDETNKNFSNDKYGALYNKDKTFLYYYPPNSKFVSYTFPNTIKSVSYDAFIYNNKLNNIIVPENIKSLEEEYMPTFFGCKELKKVLFLSKDFTINDYNSRFSKDIVLYGHGSSPMENYSEKQELDFVNIDSEPHSHDYFIIDYVDATKEKDGYANYWCYCGDEYTEVLHRYGERTQENSTCVKEGRIYEKCENCGYEHVIENTEKVNHTYVVKNFSEGDCSTNSVTTYECSVCGDTYMVDYIDDAQHSYVETIVEPTCTKAGYTEYKCSVCGDNYRCNFTSPKGHSYNITHTPPTCIDYEILTYKCSVCNEVKTSDDKSKGLSEHTPSDWIIDKKPTYLEDGSRHKECTVCKTVLATETISMLDDITAPEIEIKVKDNSFKSFINNISFGLFFKDTVDVNITAQDAESGVEKVEYIKTNTPISESDIALQTEWISGEKLTVSDDEEFIIYVKATDKQGNISYAGTDGMVVDKTAPVINGITNNAIYCQPVSFIVSDRYIEKVIVNGTEALTDSGEYILPSNDSQYNIVAVDKAGNETVYNVTVNDGHTYGDWVTDKSADCTNKGEKHRACSICGHRDDVEIPALGHDYSNEFTVDIEPTCTTAGEKSKHCSRCDNRTDITVISATGHSFGEWKTVASPDCTNSGSRQRVCTACGFTETENLNPNGHKWNSDYTIDIPTTCTTNGSKSIHCANCDAVKDSQIIPATGHNLGEYKVIEPATCTEKGLEKRACANCDYSETREIPALGHNYAEEFTVDKAPTCTENGEKSRHCSRCDSKMDITVVTALDHKWDSGVVTKDATCTNNGTKTFSCSVCQEIRIEIILAKGHNLGEYKVIKQATCVDNGLEKRICADCDFYETREISELGHDYLEEFSIDKAPTCTESGEKSRHCSRCASKADITIIPATGHSYGEWTVVTAPTCTEKGTQQRVCSICGNAEVKEISATGHIWNDDYTVDREHACTIEGSKSIHCANCDATKDSVIIPAVGHSGGKANCHSGAICDACGKEYGEPDLSNHDGETEIRGYIAPTVDNFGYTGDTYCKSCGTKLADGERIGKLPPETTEPTKPSDTTENPTDKAEPTTQKSEITNTSDSVNKNTSKKSPATGSTTALPIAVSTAFAISLICVVKRKKKED